MTRATFTFNRLAVLTGISGVMACSCLQDEPPNLQGAQPPWTLESPADTSGDGLRVLIVHDMEGLSGQDDWRSFLFGQELYSRGQELLAGDLNAVIDGLFAGGADEVHVVDGHASGNPDPDARADLLDPRVQQITMPTPFIPYMEVLDTGPYDGIVLVGQHAKTGRGGFAAHTWTAGIEVEIGGQSITETELLALTWGRVGVPVIFVSGDDRLAQDLQSMPWIEYVAVKDSTTASSIDLQDIDAAHSELMQAGEAAVRNIDRARTMRIALPIALTVRAGPPTSLTSLEGIPGLDYEDGEVSFVLDELDTAWTALNALSAIAAMEFVKIKDEVIAAHPAAAEIQQDYVTALVERWFEVEDGRYVEAAVPEPSEATRHFGIR